MKKALIAIFTAILLAPNIAQAEEPRGAWVKVDANGNAIGQAIVCTQSVCGNANSLYNQMTLQPNERYVLQAPSTPNGNVAGVGAGQGPTSVKVDLETKIWTVVNESKITEPIITILPNGDEKITHKVVGIQTATQRFTSEYAPWVSPVIQYPTIITQTPIEIPTTINAPQQISPDKLLKIKKKIAKLNKKLK